MKIEKQIVTQSELGAYRSCPQLHEWRYECGYVPRGLLPVSTLIGKTIHLGLELYYKGWLSELCSQEILREWDDFIKRFSPDMTDEQLHKYERGQRDTVAIFRNYLKYYKTQDLPTALHPKTGVPLVELEFEIPIYTPAGHPSRFFKLRGKIDRIIEDNGFWVQETKTRDQIEVDEDPTSISSSGSRLVLDQQSRTYAFAAQVYLGLPIQGTIYNLIRRRVPGRPKINKNGTVSLQMCDTTPELYKQALDNQHAYLTGLSEEERKEKKLAADIDFEKYQPELERIQALRWFHRHPQPYSVEDYRRVQLELYQTAMDLHRARYRYRNDRACDHWSGCRYKRLCMGQDPDQYYNIRNVKHSELDPNAVLHPPLGKPYVIETEDMDVVGFDATLAAVNA